jgi:uncharacterized membrane protein
MSFDIFFNPEKGLGVDFSFLHFWMPFNAVVVVALALVALRVRKILKDKQAAKVSPVVSDEGFDWSTF